MKNNLLSNTKVFFNILLLNIISISLFNCGGTSQNKMLSNEEDEIPQHIIDESNRLYQQQQNKSKQINNEDEIPQYIIDESNSLYQQQQNKSKQTNHLYQQQINRSYNFEDELLKAQIASKRLYNKKQNNRNSSNNSNTSFDEENNELEFQNLLNESQAALNNLLISNSSYEQQLQSQKQTYHNAESDAKYAIKLHCNINTHQKHYKNHHQKHYKNRNNKSNDGEEKESDNINYNKKLKEAHIYVLHGWTDSSYSMNSIVNSLNALKNKFKNREIKVFSPSRDTINKTPGQQKNGIIQIMKQNKSHYSNVNTIVIGHSLGGIVGGGILPIFKNIKYFASLGSPHRGSKLLGYLVQNNLEYSIKEIISNVYPNTPNNTTGIKGLHENSYFINKHLQKIKTHLNNNKALLISGRKGVTSYLVNKHKQSINENIGGFWGNMLSVATQQIDYALKTESIDDSDPLISVNSATMKGIYHDNLTTKVFNNVTHNELKTNPSVINYLTENIENEIKSWKD